MEKIRSFVENMFLGLPDTQEVRDAKARLLEGMSDRYEELLAQAAPRRRPLSPSPVWTRPPGGSTRHSSVSIPSPSRRGWPSASWP